MRGYDATSRSRAAPSARRSSARSAAKRSSWTCERRARGARALGVEQQRILERLAREEPFREAGQEHRVERSAERVRQRADEDAAVAARRRLGVEERESIGEHRVDLLERDRSDVGHRTQLGEQALHALGVAQDEHGETLEQRSATRPTARLCGSAARASTIGRAKRARLSRRSISRRRYSVSVTSSEAVWRRRRLSSSRRPASRRRQRSRPPITAASTRSRSQAAGVGRVGPGRARRRRRRAAGSRLLNTSWSSDDGSTHGTSTTGGGAPDGSGAGVSPSDRYSANRDADRPSAAHASSARNARPAGSGRLVPRLKNAGTPPRRSASSSRGR